MKKAKNKLNNNNIWKWTVTSLFLLLFGGSLIINITYLPKYYALKNRNDNALKIDITAYNETETASTSPLFFLQYQTTMATLGDLMEQYPDNYHLSGAGGLGRALKAISWDGNTLSGDPSSKTGPYWMIYYNDQLAPVGIDSLYLHMSDQIQLKLENKK